MHFMPTYGAVFVWPQPNRGMITPGFSKDVSWIHFSTLAGPSGSLLSNIDPANVPLLAKWVRLGPSCPCALVPAIVWHVMQTLFMKTCCPCCASVVCGATGGACWP